MNSEVEEDFLENDPEIRGQTYCLLSFISPEKVLKDKNMYFIQKFLEHKAPDLNLDADKVSEQYKDFMYTREENLETEFNKQNDFRTSVRGVKVRGTYDNLKEAQIKAKRLQTRDKNFHVFVGQVGYWLPWDPQADYIENQEFQNAELNKLMKEYKTNSEHRDVLYEEQKAEKINKIKEENEEIKRQNELNNPQQEPEPELLEPEPDLPESSMFSSEDPWTQQKLSKQ